jgi:hypothetical protein
MELLPSCHLSGSNTVPTEWVRVPKSDLAGPLPWYKSIAGSADATEEAPGAISVFSTGTTDAFSLEVRGVFEFKTAVAPANTPAAVALRDQVRTLRKMDQLLSEKQRLLAVLAAKEPSTGVRALPGGN